MYSNTLYLHVSYLVYGVLVLLEVFYKDSRLSTFFRSYNLELGVSKQIIRMRRKIHPELLRQITE